MRKSPRLSPEVIERVVRIGVRGQGQYPSQWAAIESIAGKIGCTAETLRQWVRRGERDSGARPGPTTAEQQRIKELEREVRELPGPETERRRAARAQAGPPRLKRSRLARPAFAPGRTSPGPVLV